MRTRGRTSSAGGARAIPRRPRLGGLRRRPAPAGRPCAIPTRRPGPRSPGLARTPPARRCLDRRPMLTPDDIAARFAPPLTGGALYARQLAFTDHAYGLAEQALNTLPRGHHL